MLRRPFSGQSRHLRPQFSNSVEFDVGFEFHSRVLPDAFPDAVISYANIKCFVSSVGEKLSNQSFLGKRSDTLFYKSSFVDQ